MLEDTTAKTQLPLVGGIVMKDNSHLDRFSPGYSRLWLDKQVLLISGSGVSYSRIGFFLQALLCTENTQSEWACGRCRACLLWAENSHPDLHRLCVQGEKSSSIGIESVRSCIVSLTKSSVLSGRQVLVCSYAEELTHASANALLKLLEEPKHGLVCVLLSKNQELLLPTFLSRAFKIHLEYTDCSNQAHTQWLDELGLIDKACGQEQSEKAMAFVVEVSKLWGQSVYGLSTQALTLSDKLQAFNDQWVIRWLAAWWQALALRHLGMKDALLARAQCFDSVNDVDLTKITLKQALISLDVVEEVQCAYAHGIVLNNKNSMDMLCLKLASALQCR